MGVGRGGVVGSHSLTNSEIMTMAVLTVVSMKLVITLNNKGKSHKLFTPRVDFLSVPT